MTVRPKLYVGGTFDLLHPGHIFLLKLCSELGSVTVSLNRDEFVLRYKKVPPTQTLAERITIIGEQSLTKLARRCVG